MASSEVSQENHVNGAANEFSEKQKKYQEIISTLPRRKGWRPLESFYQYEGIWWQQDILEGAMHAQEHFKARPTDVIVCSYPKTGTTWLKALTYAIVKRTSYCDNTNPLLKKNPHEFVPYIEIDLPFWPGVHDTTNNPLFSTHIPYSSLPKSIVSSSCKMVYVWRDPKDTFISYWTFLLKQKSEEGELASLEEAFELFCQGISVYGPYLDHVLGYWKAHQENPERILFLKYEDMRRATLPSVKKLAEFMGYAFSPEEEEQGAVQKVADLCSFETMKNLEPNKGDKVRDDRPAVYANSAYFRKGKVGDWRNYLSSEMAARMDGIMEEKFKGTNLLSGH